MKRYLVVRFSSIGDVILTTPIIRALKKQYAEVHVLTKHAFRSIFDHNPYVDRLFLLKDNLDTILKDINRYEYDGVIDLHNNARSLRVRKAIAAPAYVYQKMRLERFLLVAFKVDWIRGKHIVDRYFEAVQPLGITKDDSGLDYFLPSVDLDPFKVDPGSYIAIVVGTAHFTKTMPKQLIIDLIAAIDIPVVLIGGKEERKRWRKSKYGGKKVNNLVGKTDLDASVAIIKNAMAVVTGDTGMMHAAAALDKKIVVVLGSTVPALGFMPYMPQSEHRYSIVQNDNIGCRPCTKMGRSKCPKRHFDCMKSLKAVDIVDQLYRLIDNN